MIEGRCVDMNVSGAESSYLIAALCWNFSKKKNIVIVNSLICNPKLLHFSCMSSLIRLHPQIMVIL